MCTKNWWKCNRTTWLQSNKCAVLGLCYQANDWIVPHISASRTQPFCRSLLCHPPNHPIVDAIRVASQRPVGCGVGGGIGSGSVSTAVFDAAAHRLAKRSMTRRCRWWCRRFVRRMECHVPQVPRAKWLNALRVALIVFAWWRRCAAGGVDVPQQQQRVVSCLCTTAYTIELEFTPQIIESIRACIAFRTNVARALCNSSALYV